VLLAAIALSFSLALGAVGPSVFAQAAPARSQLPATQPGLSRDEGVFLVTAADDGTRLVYFIAQNTRHSTLPGDLQLEQQLNSLWPVRAATRDEVLAFPEAAPVGTARTGLLNAPDVAEPSPVDAAPVAEAPAAVEAPVAVAAPDVTEVPVAVDAPAPVAAEVPVTAEVPVAAEAPVAADPPVAAEAPAPNPDLLARVRPAPTIVDAPPAIADAPPDASDSSIYVLRPGDNLTHLSASYSTTIPAILAANGLSNANRIYVGQALIIPGTAVAPETIPSAAPVPDVVESPAAPMPVAAAEPDPVADAPASTDAVTYTVKAGDSAIHIARQFGVDVDALLAANGVPNRNRVYVGQVLSIPGA
jgi:LysM repeat protein